jgi:hypothetical protein
LTAAQAVTPTADRGAADSKVMSAGLGVRIAAGVVGLCSAGEVADDLVPDGEVVDALAQRGDPSGEVVALALGEARRPDVGEDALPDAGLARVDGGHRDAHEHFAGSGLRTRSLVNFEDFRAAISRELHRSGHGRLLLT